MKILSYNIMSGGFDSYSPKSNVPKRLKLIKKVISDIDADFVGLIDTFRWKEVFTLDDLRKHFRYQNVFCIDMNDTRADKRVGLTVLSKFDIPCEQLRIYNRNCIKSTVKKGRYEYEIFTVYLDDLSEDTRLCEVKSLLSQTLQKNTVIMGDLNTFAKSDFRHIPKDMETHFRKNPDLYKNLKSVVQEMKRGDVVDLLQQEGFVNGMPTFQPTAPSKLFPGGFSSPFLRIDYVFHTKDVKLNAVDVLRSDILDKTSDHFPLYFEL